MSYDVQSIDWVIKLLDPVNYPRQQIAVDRKVRLLVLIPADSDIPPTVTHTMFPLGR